MHPADSVYRWTLAELGTSYSIEKWDAPLQNAQVKMLIPEEADSGDEEDTDDDEDEDSEGIQVSDDDDEDDDDDHDDDDDDDGDHDAR